LTIELPGDRLPADVDLPVIGDASVLAPPTPPALVELRSLLGICAPDLVDLPVIARAGVGMCASPEIGVDLPVIGQPAKSARFAPFLKEILGRAKSRAENCRKPKDISALVKIFSAALLSI
jgi:hypothetical protein